MSHIPIPDGVKVCMKYSNAGQQLCNIFYCKVDDPITASLLIDIAEMFKDWWLDNLQARTAGTVSLEAIEVSDVSVDGGLGIVYTTDLPASGNGDFQGLPNNVTVATKLTTGFTGRSYRGRSYFIGLRPDDLTADKQHIVAGTQTALQTAFLDLIGDLAAAGWPLAVASLYTAGAPRAAGVLTLITNAIVNNVLDSQRRRLPERGA